MLRLVDDIETNARPQRLQNLNIGNLNIGYFPIKSAAHNLDLSFDSTVSLTNSTSVVFVVRHTCIFMTQIE